MYKIETGAQRLYERALHFVKGKGDGEYLFHKQSHFLLLKSSSASELNATLYNPVICLILQGAKEVLIGKRKITVNAGDALLVSHALPVVSRIAEASRQNPYLAIILRINLNLIRNLYENFEESVLPLRSSQSLTAGEIGEKLSESFLRLLNASQNRLDSIVLYNQILQEVHFRMLQAPFSGMLWDLLKIKSHASNISKAISIIRKQYEDTLSILELAKAVGMSTSSFHHHFKSITGSTPLQYQKDLRLLEARKLLTSSGVSVTSAALKVGYESPNQFSREYTRKFGSNPRIDKNKIVNSR